MRIKNPFLPLKRFVIILIVITLLFILKEILIIPMILIDFPASLLTLFFCCGDYPHPLILFVNRVVFVLLYATLINFLVNINEKN